MKKDPAVLFYPKDWLQGTASMYPEEKGIFIDLLMHQHQDGWIPNCTKRLARLVGVDHDRFKVTWEDTLQNYFIAHPTQPSALINRRMDFERSQRQTSAKKKTVMSVVGNWVRYSTYAKKMGVQAVTEMKKMIDWDRLINNSLSAEDIQAYLDDLSLSLSKGLPKGVAQRSQYGDGDGDGDVITIEGKEEGYGEKPEKIDFNGIAKAYNNSCPNLTQVQRMTDARKASVKARIKEFGIDSVHAVIEYAADSPFLNGDNDKGWTADFDWIFRPGNFMKILEGKYKNNGKSRQQAGQSRVEYSDDFKRQIAQRLQSR